MFIYISNYYPININIYKRIAIEYLEVITMDLIIFIGKRVKIILNNEYYYIGKVINADDTSLDLLDIKGQNVSIAKSSISTIQEVRAE